MMECWYNITQMWCDAWRAFVFSAFNTTTNRVESWWGQFKDTVGPRKRIDYCIEAIFILGVTVARREQSDIQAHAIKTRLLPNKDPFLRAILMELSLFTAAHCLDQWNKFVVNDSAFNVVDTRGTKHDVVCQTGGTTSSSTYSVDVSEWSCSCSHYTSGHLPCEHIFFVARDVELFTEAPVDMIPRRWRMSEAIKLLPVTSKVIGQLGVVRVAVTQAMDAGAIVEPSTAPLEYTPTTTSIAYVKLRKHERATSTVLNDLEKRREVMSVFGGILQYMMSLGSANFNVHLESLQAVFVHLLDVWQQPDLSLLHALLGPDGDVWAFTDSLHSVMGHPMSPPAFTSTAMQSVSADVDGDDHKVTLTGVSDGPTRNVSWALTEDSPRIEHGEEIEAEPIIPDATGTAGPENATAQAEDNILPDDDLATSSSGVLSTIRLPPHLGPGNKRRSKQEEAHSSRLLHVTQNTQCPVYLEAALTYLAHGPLCDVVRFHVEYPDVFNGETFPARSPVVREYDLDSELHRPNYITSHKVLNAVKAAFQLAIPKPRVEPRTPERQFAARYSSTTCAITETAVEQIEEFHKTASLLHKYVQDCQWVSTSSLWSVPVGAAPLPFMQTFASEVEGADDTLDTTRMRARIAPSSSTRHLRPFFTIHA